MTRDDQNNSRTARSAQLHGALGLLEDLTVLGLTVAPLQPTAAMLGAGAEAGGVPPETARRVYEAMVAAAE